MTREIEICTNAEWLGCGDLAEGTPFTENELANVYFDAAFCSLNNFGWAPDEIVTAKGQRMLYHGWNGSQFRFRVGGIGTFDKLTDDQEGALESAHDAGMDAMNEAVAKYQEAK